LVSKYRCSISALATDAAEPDRICSVETITDWR
jgi:hypothetical protein